MACIQSNTFRNPLMTDTLYEAHPFVADPSRANVISYLMDELADFDILFPDNLPRCEEAGEEERVCGECERCLARKQWVAAGMVKPDARFWEIWSADEEMPIGIVYLTNIKPGLDAIAHYVFFDGKLSDKTPILESLMEWFFVDHRASGWQGLERITLEIPEHYFALARHAFKKLGFGGPFQYETKGLKVPVEGVRRKAYWHSGRAWDTLLLGRLNTFQEAS